MIEVTQKTTRLEGTKVQLMSEFCCLVHHLVTKDDGADEAVLTREELDKCIEMATMSDDELHQKTLDALADEVHQKTLDALAEIFDMFGKFL